MKRMIRASKAKSGKDVVYEIVDGMVELNDMLEVTSEDIIKKYDLGPFARELTDSIYDAMRILNKEK